MITGGARGAALLAALSVCLPACGAGDPAVTGDTAGDADVSMPMPMALGEVIELEAGSDGRLRGGVYLDDAAAELVAIVYPASWAAADPTFYQLDADLAGAPWPALHTSAPVAPPTAWGTRSSPAHLRGYAELVAGLGAGLSRPAVPPPHPLPPSVGEFRDFSVLGDNRVVTATFEAVHVGAQVAFWLDISSTPAASISAADLRDIAAAYQDIVLPREEVFFGPRSDVDGNSLVFVLLSPVVNENDGPVAYFYPCDLLAPGAAGCSYSNQAEVLYLSPPNTIGPPFNTVNAIVETMAHETQHMVFFNTKHLLNASFAEPENMYLLEGLAALAQDLTGYQAGNLYVSWYGLDLIASEFALRDVLRDDGAYIGARDGGLRGGAYLLLRYLYDQAGGDEVLSDGAIVDTGGVTWLNELCGSATTGLAGLEASLPRPLDGMLWNFYTALAVTNRGADLGPISVEPAYNYLPTAVDPLTGKQRGFNAYAPLHMGAMTGPATVAYGQETGQLRLTGVNYVLLAPGRVGWLELTAEGMPDADCRVRLARIK